MPVCVPAESARLCGGPLGTNCCADRPSGPRACQALGRFRGARSRRGRAGPGPCAQPAGSHGPRHRQGHAAARARACGRPGPCQRHGHGPRAGPHWGGRGRACQLQAPARLLRRGPVQSTPTARGSADGRIYVRRWLRSPVDGKGQAFVVTQGRVERVWPRWSRQRLPSRPVGSAWCARRCRPRAWPSSRSIPPCTSACPSMSRRPNPAPSSCPQE